VSDEPRRVETVKATYLGRRNSTIMTDWDRHERPLGTALRAAVEADGRATTTDAGRAVERQAVDV
jgi:hypothetical protein